MDTIFAGEAGQFVLLVLPDATGDVIGNADVEYAGLAGHYVHVIIVHWESRSFALLRMTSSGRDCCGGDHSGLCSFLANGRTARCVKPRNCSVVQAKAGPSLRSG